MENFLTICTILGGIAAIWYFLEKIYRREEKNKINYDDIIKTVIDRSNFQQPNITYKASTREVKSTETKTETLADNLKLLAKESEKPLIYCKYCGSDPGKRLLCVGSRSAHNFQSFTGRVICEYCGTKPGERTLCVGKRLEHNFETFQGKIYCKYCGSEPGERLLCVGSRLEHNFQSYIGRVICEYCGTKPGERLLCVGTRLEHNFRTY
ncbi:MAG: hypothetical protein WC600_17525 [Desulfobaccales bacterium]